MLKLGTGALRDMAKPKIFTISAEWDEESAVWTGHCDEIPAAADAPTLDELLSKMTAIALDLLPDNHPNIDPASVFVQITSFARSRPRGRLMAPHFDRALRDPHRFP